MRRGEAIGAGENGGGDVVGWSCGGGGDAEWFCSTVFRAGARHRKRAGRVKGIRVRKSKPVLVTKPRALYGPPAAVCAAIPGRSFRTAVQCPFSVSPFFAQKG